MPAETAMAAGVATNGGIRMNAPAKEMICEARFCAPGSIYVRFHDIERTIPIADLGLSPLIRWDNLELSPTGEAIMVTLPTGERVPIDASNFRYHADPEYAARMEAAFDELLLDDDDGPPDGFFDQPAQTPRF